MKPYPDAVVPDKTSTGNQLHLKRQGKTVVAVTHDERWFAAGDRLLKLEHGKAVEDSLISESV